MGASQKLFYLYSKAFGNLYLKTALGTRGASLIQNGGVNVRTQEQIDGALADLEYSSTASEQAGLGQTTYELSAS
ncbi:hypothetical protein [Rufibacter latericius]|uniref:Uncharacterized protein n=1 Tax=Rufibacter latericius TaxID=2487040 RepID=A0A3M9M9Z6_9BACT|nr:hypothetical protein [Rufibacter latericius]RNI22035.1 hypothetical protein EFB08_23165 [Rufibacter latericius]